MLPCYKPALVYQLIEKGIWVRPTAGNFSSGSWFLCVSDPYHDPQELERQKNYWKEKYDVELSEKSLVKVQLFRTQISYKQSGETAQLIPTTKKHYIYPLECLEEDKTKGKNYEKLEKKYKEIKKDRDELLADFEREDLKNLKESLWAVDGYLKRLEREWEEGNIPKSRYHEKKKNLLKKKWNVQRKALILKDRLENTSEKDKSKSEKNSQKI